MDENKGLNGAKNERALLNLIEKSGYSMIQENGQRKFGGPPPGWNGPPPGRGCEIFVGKIPRDCFEDELVPAFEKVGKIYEFRLMMDFSGSNRGYAFVMYCNKDDAHRAVREMNNFEIRKGRLLGVCPSVDNCRLFVGGIPKNKHKEEIMTEMKKVTEGVNDVIVYPSAMDKTKNRGFAFVEYESHRAAAMARRKLIPGRIQLWGHQIAVDWAEPEQDVDDDVMNKVGVSTFTSYYSSDDVCVYSLEYDSKKFNFIYLLQNSSIFNSNMESLYFQDPNHFKHDLNMYISKVHELTSSYHKNFSLYVY